MFSSGKKKSWVPLWNTLDLVFTITTRGTPIRACRSSDKMNLFLASYGGEGYRSRKKKAQGASMIKSIYT
jgi:hypothetical protein